VPAPSSSFPTRVGAFALAGVISTLAGVFMWPRFERVTLCKQAAKACLRMADLVEALNAGGDATELQRRIDAARAAEQAARREYVATAKRPAGPGPRWAGRRPHPAGHCLPDDRARQQRHHYGGRTAGGERGALRIGERRAWRRHASRSRDDPHAPRPLFHGGPIESARGYRPGHWRGAGESPGTTARILGRPGNAPGAAIERGGHRTHDGAGDRRQPAGRRPWWALRPRRGHQRVLLWSVLPFAIFLAAYASTAIGFAAGQAAFSLLLIIMFNLIVPTGWQIGVVRIEDLLVGVAISVVVGVLLWPRGVRRALAHAIARFYRAIS